MYPVTIAGQLRNRGHDVASIHDANFRKLEGAPDEDVFAAAVAERRVLVTEGSKARHFHEAKAPQALSSRPTGSFLADIPPPAGGWWSPWMPYSGLRT